MRVRRAWLASALVACTFSPKGGGGGGASIGDGETGGEGTGSTASGPGTDAGVDAGDDPSAGSETTMGSGDDVGDETGGCTPGAVGCACDGRACDRGLLCTDGTCVSESCGDDVRDPWEECDDGNLLLGDGCDACVPSPGVKDIVAGMGHTCALLWTGGVRCWGNGVDGRLGYGNPAKIGDDEHPYEAANVPVGAPVVALAAGNTFTCALLDDGAVRCWGAHAAGQLGNGSGEAIGDDEEASDSAVVMLGDDAAQISSGEHHSCAVLQDNSVVCWGEGGQGRLGHGTQDDIGDDETPESRGPVDVGGDVAQVAAGGSHTCALLVSGDVVCWGDGGNGRLGYGDNQSIGESNGEVPADKGTVPIGAKVQAVRTGGAHTCVLLEGGAVRCWGQNNAGQCGYPGGGSLGDAADETPDMLPDIDVGAPVVSITTGTAHTCAVLEDGTAKCWGEGTDGRLGYEGVMDVIEPAKETLAISRRHRVLRLAAGGEHTCARLDLGNVRCWGRGDVGQLGYAGIESLSDEPGEPPGGAGDVLVLPP